jgi:hypothetical protein
MLVVMLPQKDVATWFFKLVGRENAVEAHRGEFEEFLNSVKFPDERSRPITWKVPQGWERYARSRVNYANFHVGTKDSPVSFTVTQLGPDARDPLSNVNRWRDQLGLKPIKKEELGAIFKEIKLEAGTAYYVDLVGPKPGDAAAGPAPGITYKKPDGWKKRSDPSGVRVVVFDISDGDQSAEIGVTSLEGDAGGLLLNVNRWRAQLGVKDFNDDQLKEETRSIQVFGKAGAYFDMTAQEKDDRTTKRILGVAVEVDGKTWFVKMIGPKELVGKEKETFEAFVKSIEIESNAGDK